MPTSRETVTIGMTELDVDYYWTEDDLEIECILVRGVDVTDLVTAEVKEYCLRAIVASAVDRNNMLLEAEAERRFEERRDRMLEAA